MRVQIARQRHDAALAGMPQDLYHHPATLEVGTFIGAPRMNILEDRGGH
ncbi:TPA: hypothetical protein ACSRGI_004212 [Klebsiella variicola subsp. variicola]